jgi:flagellar biosynthesis/type III secretory pathway protein FliH
MKVEELIVTLAESSIDRKASDEIIRKLVHYELLKKLRKSEKRAKGIMGRAKAYDNGYKNGLRDGKAKEPEYFTVLETCKEDMKYHFEDSPKVLAKIEELTDEQMEEIAIDIGDQLVKYYGDALELAVEAEREYSK